jgi:hypothetical protein
MVSLSALILSNIFFVFITGRFVVESLITIVVFFWLFNQNQKSIRSASELGIDITAMKRVLSE